MAELKPYDHFAYDAAMKKLPVDEHGFIEGSFTLILEWSNESE